MTTGLTPYHGIFSRTAGATSAHKPPFSQLPQRICTDLCTLAGAQSIASSEIAAGGVSASAAYLLRFDNGVKLFVKGSHPGDQSHGAENLRGECGAYRSIDILSEVAPQFCGMVYADHGDDNGWWLGAWQAVTQQPINYDVKALSALLDRVACADIPASAGVPVAIAHPYLSQFMNDTYKWRRLLDDKRRGDKFTQCFADPVAAAMWLDHYGDKLVALQSAAATQSWHLGLIHGDLRCDNFIHGHINHEPARWWMIDWANAADGPLAFDRVMLAASLLAEGACDVSGAMHFASQGCGEDDSVKMMVMQAGYFADQIYRLPPAVMPRLRPIQKAMFAALIAMLVHAGIVAPLPDLTP